MPLGGFKAVTDKRDVNHFVSKYQEKGGNWLEKENYGPK
jgi:hypothetical protein